MSLHCSPWRSTRPKCSRAGRALALLAASAALTSARVVAQPLGPMPVVASRVVEQTVTAAQTFVGTVEPLKHAVIGSAVDGRVVEFPIEAGDRVDQGQKLAQLMTETITLELAAAEAELENRRYQLEELENGVRPEELEQARATMAAAEARRDFLKMRRDRLESVADRPGAVTDDEIDEAISAAIEASEAYLSAKAAYELAVAGPREEQIAQAKALLALQQAVVDRISDQIKKHTIISRFGGYVVQEHTEIGQWVNRGDPVAEVVAIDQVDVVVQVVEKSAPFIRPSELVRVEIPAVPDRIFAGKIVATVPQADVRARTFPVKVRVDNEIDEDGPLLKAGMYARVALPVGQKQTALLVPKDAIVLGGPAPMIYTVDPSASVGDEVAVAVTPVQLGVASGEKIQILGDVRPGQLVVHQGNERLRPGQQVKLLRIDAEPQAADPSTTADRPSATTNVAARSATAAPPSPAAN